MAAGGVDMSGKGSNSTGTPDYSDRDIRMRPLIRFSIATAIITVATLFGMTVLFRSIYRQVAKEYPASRFASERTLPAGPLLQVDEVRSLQDHLRIEEEALSTYGWVDRTGGVVRIPIDRAMELLVARGVSYRTNGIPR